MRVLITGSRAGTPEMIKAGAELIAKHLPSDEHHTVVHGAARGFDKVGPYLDQHFENFTQEAHPAKWDTYGRRAGPIRNQEMVNLGADICYAFKIDGVVAKGTEHCAQAALKAGIKVVRVTFPSEG